jgi:hypothetical protein
MVFLPSSAMMTCELPHWQAIFLVSLVIGKDAEEFRKMLKTHLFGTKTILERSSVFGGITLVRLNP